MPETIVHLENIGVRFTQKNKIIQAVKDVSLRINKGDIYGIVGYSGAGKSTLVRVVNLLQVPTEGRLVVDDQVLFDKGQVQLSAQNLREKRREIGMIFQHFNLMSQKTAAENIAFALKHSGLSKEEKDKKVKELLELVGLAERADNYPSQLSGGQKQRVAIARALANDPKILISDESTSALDPKTTKQILQLLQELNERLGLTIIMITHEMQIVKDIANRVAVMQDGQLVEEGSVLDIFSTPKNELTQDFMETATGIDEALRKIQQQEVVQHLGADQELVHLKFTGSATDQAVVHQLSKHYEVAANILFANIEILDHTPVGEMIVILSGQKEQLTKARTGLLESGVGCSVLKEGK